jgi:hypothetical protein
MFSLNKEPSPSKMGNILGQNWLCRIGTKLTLSYWDKTDFVSRPRLLSSLVDNAKISLTVYSYFMPVQGSQNYWTEVLEMIWELLPEAGDDLRTVPKSSPGPRDNNFDCSLNRHEITVLLSYIHAHNHKFTEYDNDSIPYH